MNDRLQAADGKATRVNGSSGGVADKQGNKYELLWAVYYALKCIQDERCSITFEDPDPTLAEGSEFTFVDYDGSIQVTQIKRQNSYKNNWTIRSLNNLGIFAAAAKHVEDGHKYYFRSTTPCAKIRELSDRARQSDDLQQFITHQLSEDLKIEFNNIANFDPFIDPKHAWETLRGMWIESWEEQQLKNTNSMLASVLLEGAEGRLLVEAIGAILLEKLRLRLTRRELLEELKRRGIRLLSQQAKETAHEKVIEITKSWTSAIERELLDLKIRKNESKELLELLCDENIVLVVGGAGSGKSSLVYQAVNQLNSENSEILAFRVDRLDFFSSKVELGTKLGLASSPVTSLVQAAGGRDALLIIDQLDAVSLTSGRSPERYDVIADLIEDAIKVGGVKVVLVCRLFDVENDERLRKLDANKNVIRFNVPPLADADVSSAISTFGFDPKLLNMQQLELLKIPLNLVLLSAIGNQNDALKFNSHESLLGAFWTKKRQAIKQKHPHVRFSAVLQHIAEIMSNQQTLSVVCEKLDHNDYINDAEILASEGILSIEKRRISFFHEIFFDYTFVRQWLEQEKTLLDFLCEHEQELFRRAQVRQILQMLRGDDTPRFRSEVKSLLTSEKIRFHIKDLVMAVFANVDEPDDEDIKLVLDIDQFDDRIGKRLWKYLCRPNWFDLLYKRKIIQSWLGSGNIDLRERGIIFLSNSVSSDGKRVVQILNEQKEFANYRSLLLQLMRKAQLSQDRSLFELILKELKLGVIRSSDYSLWLAIYELNASKPRWAIELMRACLAVSLLNLTSQDGAKIAMLDLEDNIATQAIGLIAKARPHDFVESVVPYLLEVMTMTETEEKFGGLHDGYFCLPCTDHLHANNVGDALYKSSIKVLVNLTSVEHERLYPLLLTLSKDRHAAAQVLLFKALISGYNFFSDWAADLMIERRQRLECGDFSDCSWISRELVKIIAPNISDEQHCKLENRFRDWLYLDKSYRSSGSMDFKFLSALDEKRLSLTGKKRLEDYRRKFSVETFALTPEMATNLESPISVESAIKMSDDAWLSAMRKYSSESCDNFSRTGGAKELAQVLESLVVEYPLRFAGIALQMPKKINPTYPSAILRGFGDASIQPEDRQHIVDAIKHIIGLGLPDCDRQLGWSLREILDDDVPLDLVELVRDRVFATTDPVEECSNTKCFTYEHFYSDRLRNTGINTSRGSLIELLGHLLSYDTDGARTAVVAPSLLYFAKDPNLGVRACVAYVISSCFLHDRDSAYKAFAKLVDCQDDLFVSPSVLKLIARIGSSDLEIVVPIIYRMLSSSVSEVRNAGGRLAAFAGLKWDCPELLEYALEGDVDIRTGIAIVCSELAGEAEDSDLEFRTLCKLIDDDDDEVCKVASQFVDYLPGKDISLLKKILIPFIESRGFEYYILKVFRILQDASGRIDELVIFAAIRFFEIHDANGGENTWSEVNDFRVFLRLVVRALSHASGENNLTLLEILDTLVQYLPYGFTEEIEDICRG